MTVNVAVLVAPLPSVAVKVNVALEAAQEATTSAVIVPEVLTMLEIVTPLDGFALVTATVMLPAGVASSETVAMIELLAALPCCRTSGPAAVIVGGELTASVKLAVEVAPQLSVAVTVTV